MEYFFYLGAVHMNNNTIDFAFTVLVPDIINVIKCFLNKQKLLKS